MHVIYARNVNDALPQGLAYLKEDGVEEGSRVGPVVVSPVPVTTLYERPKEHVLFSAVRNANPVFHVLEALWMLAGRNDVAFPARYAAQLQLYSDDSETLNGAYGYRWRAHFGYDQVNAVIEELRKNPASRRCVIAMWDAMNVYHDYTEDGGPAVYEGDLKRGISGGADIPCNTHVYFRVNAGRLDMTVCNRSNDVVWGAYGANAVHFSILQEYVALSLGVPLGAYYQVANNFHYYREREDVKRLLSAPQGALYDNRYTNERALTLPLFVDKARFDAELLNFVESPTTATLSERFLVMAQALARAHELYKQDVLNSALFSLNAPAERHKVDWVIATREWLQRIQAARAAKAAQ